MKTAFKALPMHSTTTVSGATITANQDMFTVGAGYLDVAAALGNYDKSTRSARSPIAVYNASSGKVTLDFASGGSNVIWGDGSTWSTNVR